MQSEVYATCQAWLDSLPGIQREQILHHLGQFPAMDPEFSPNGPAWLWWMVSVLPLDPRIQNTMLAMTSYKERLDGVKRVLMYMSRKRSRWLLLKVVVTNKFICCLFLGLAVITLMYF